MTDLPTTPNNIPTTDLNDTLSALQVLVERQIERMDTLKRQVKTHAESMKSIVENDTELSEVENQVKEMSKKVKERKKTLTESPEFRELRAKATELKEEVKELEESLNTHLLSYYQQTGVKTIDLQSGARDFKIVARVLPKKEQL